MDDAAKIEKQREAGRRGGLAGWTAEQHDKNAVTWRTTKLETRLEMAEQQRLWFGLQGATHVADWVELLRIFYSATEAAQKKMVGELSGLSCFEKFKDDNMLEEGDFYMYVVELKHYSCGRMQRGQLCCFQDDMCIKFGMTGRKAGRLQDYRNESQTNNLEWAAIVEVDGKTCFETICWEAYTLQRARIRWGRQKQHLE